MNDKTFGGRMLAFLASLRLAVVTMVTLASVCGYATFYEMRHGTPAVQRDIYQTPWFAAILGVLAINVFSVMVSRYRWTKHHTGFLMAHVGILLLLTGSVISLHRGLDSSMALFEGETSDRVALLEKALQVSVPGLGVNGTFPVAFEKRAPRPGHEQRFPVPSDVVLVVDDYYPHVSVTEGRSSPRAPLVRTVKPETPPAEEERRQPAVRLHLEGPRGNTEPEWVLWGERVRVAYGGEPVSIGFQSPEAVLPFKVTLLRFNNEPYPGSRMASTFESTVRVEDPEQGTFESLISMNHPLHHRGYVFFQSSFVEGRPMMSIFSVARAPGLPLVYLGTTLIGVGIVWMFYVKPWLAKRQAAMALAAHRARESRNEAKPADPVADRV
jgi:hypothetical protein